MTVERETRRYPRRNTDKAMLVVWKKGSQKYVSHMGNLGLGGLFICTQQPPPVGTSLQLLFNVPEGEVRGLAIVRNLAPSRGMSLAIVSMEQEHRARLDRWLKRLAVEVEPVASSVTSPNPQPRAGDIVARLWQKS
jgi:hypothetical protein